MLVAQNANNVRYAKIIQFSVMTESKNVFLVIRMDLNAVIVIQIV